jgi:hypothetical protein
VKVIVLRPHGRDEALATFELMIKTGHLN